MLLVLVGLLDVCSQSAAPPSAVTHRSGAGIQPAIVLSSLPQSQLQMTASTSPNSARSMSPPHSHPPPPSFHLHYRTEPYVLQPTPPPRSPVEHHPAVSSRLCLYFRTLLLNRDGLLSFDEYCSFYIRLSKLLFAPHFQLSVAKGNAQYDWELDMRKSGGGGERSMDCDTFCHSLFEIVDMFVLLHDAQQLVFLLNKVYTLLTQSSSSYPSLPSSSSSSPSPAVVTFLPLASLVSHIPFNAHDRHNSEYNQYAHSAAHLLRHQLHDGDIEFTVPLLPPLSVDPLRSSTAAGKERSVGGLKQGPTRNGLHCSIGAMDELYTVHSPYAAMLPAQWSVANWQRDNRRKQQLAAQMAATTASSDTQEEKQSTADDSSPQQQRRGSSNTEEPFVVRERRERAASRQRTSQTVLLGGNRRSGSSSSSKSNSRRGSVVLDMDIDEDGGAVAASPAQHEPQSAAQRLSRYYLFS